MKFDIHQPVGQVAIELIDAVSIFEKYGINYYPQNQKMLTEACSSADVSLEKVAEELNKSIKLPPEWVLRVPDLTSESMAAVIRYLIHVHHVRTRLLLDKILEMVNLLVEKGRDSLRLGVVLDVFQKVNHELRNHMTEEERSVFPFLVFAERELEKTGSANRTVIRDIKASESIREILFEHRFMDKGFTEIQKLVYLFGNQNGKAEFKPLEETLKELAEDNVKHIHLENNVLLKRAAQLGLMD